MRLSDRALSRITKKQFWLAIACVTIPLCAMGFYEIQVGHLPKTSPWFYVSGLLITWIGVLVAAIRFRRAAFSWPYAGFVVGITLEFGAKLWPQPPAIVTWLVLLNGPLLIMSLLSPYFTFGKKNRAAVGVGNPSFF